MMAVRVGRVFLIVLSIALASAEDATYKIPSVTIQAFNPKGFRAFITGVPNQSLFAFEGNVNRKIESDQVGTITGEVLAPASDGRWILDLPNIELQVGDVINYHVFAAVANVGYVQDSLSFTIKELVDYIPLPAGSPSVVTVSPLGATTTAAPALACTPSQTILRSGAACAGQTVFEENFDSLSNVWQVENYIPLDHPELPFVSYQRSAVSVKDGHLHIRASLLEDQQGFSQDTIISGSLDLLQGCTSVVPGGCQMQAEGANILPPVVSGRVTSKPGFAFKYGTVSVRAKLPMGDWLYPEILLEPYMRKYGWGSLNFNSGVLKIACASGNTELLEDTGTSHDNRILYGGPLFGNKCLERLFRKKESTTYWGNGFHVYSVKWAPDSLTFLVDDEFWFSVRPDGNIGNSCPKLGPGLAPFNDHFYLTLGLSAGGISNFRDYLTTRDNNRKPWVNRQSKAALNFWNDRQNWKATWEQPELVVDYVKVVAL